jgi:hypothetical protein
MTQTIKRFPPVPAMVKEVYDLMIKYASYTEKNYFICEKNRIVDNTQN